MARTRIFDAAAGPATSAVIELPFNANGAACADVSIVFNTVAGAVSILVEASDGSYVPYTNMTFEASEYKTLELYSTNKIKIDLDASVTNVTVEV